MKKVPILNHMLDQVNRRLEKGMITPLDAINNLTRVIDETVKMNASNYPNFADAMQAGEGQIMIDANIAMDNELRAAYKNLVTFLEGLEK